MAQEIIQINKATPVGKRRVCAYTRVSSKSEDQENSLAYQIEAYTKMIMTNPSYEFCGVFVDDGVTGTSIYKRKEFPFYKYIILWFSSYLDNFSTFIFFFWNNIFYLLKWNT